MKMISIPFAYDLVTSNGLPLITLIEGSLTGLCFLVDTGCTQSIIFKRSVKEHMDKFTALQGKGIVWGIGGEKFETTYVSAYVKLIDLESPLVLQVVDDKPSDYYFAQTNIRMHGLLGTDFLRSHNIIIDVVNQQLLLVREENRRIA